MHVQVCVLEEGHVSISECYHGQWYLIDVSRPWCVICSDFIQADDAVELIEIYYVSIFIGLNCVPSGNERSVAKDHTSIRPNDRDVIVTIWLKTRTLDCHNLLW